MIKNKFLLLLLPLVMAVASCDKLKDFGETNKNPNSTTNPLVGALLAQAASDIGSYAALTRPGLYSQYFSETQYTDNSLYSPPALPFNGEYAGILEDLQNIRTQNVSNNENQVARILQQYVFWTITDRWGDVPYSEALSGITRPKYDKQEDIYKGMISNLKDAVSKFDNVTPITGDIIYGGVISNWKKLANSLRMLMAIQLSKRFPGAGEYAATEFKAALADAGGYIATNADNMVLDYPGGNFKNPWYNLYNGRKDFAESQPMVTLLTSFSDGRQAAYGSSTTGVPYGIARSKAEAFTGANPNWARILRADLREEGDPLVMISAAQVALARAEAADYGWTTENAFDVYKRGIELSFEQWGLAAPAASYYTQTDVAFTAPAGTGGNFKQISLQRYIASYPDGLQGWNIWRKSGYPVLTPAPDATNTPKLIPRRYIYGAFEYSSNSEATKAAAAAIGGDEMTTRVWWDKQ